MNEKEQPMFCDYDDELPCCYPIEECENCPAHPGNEDFIGGLQQQGLIKEFRHLSHDFHKISTVSSP